MSADLIELTHVPDLIVVGSLIIPTASTQEYATLVYLYVPSHGSPPMTFPGVPKSHTGNPSHFAFTFVRSDAAVVSQLVLRLAS